MAASTKMIVNAVPARTLARAKLTRCSNLELDHPDILLRRVVGKSEKAFGAASGAIRPRGKSSVHHARAKAARLTVEVERRVGGPAHTLLLLAAT